MPDDDIKIEQMSPTSLQFKVSFQSLENPDAISLESGTEQDLLVIQIPKTLILNGQEGESLILDKSDFEEEDSSSFYTSSEL